MKQISVIAILLFTWGCGASETAATSPLDTDSAPESLVGSPEVEVFGSLQQIFALGDLSATASLAEHGDSPQTVGLGAISGLRGEITILGGESWLGYPEGEDAISVVQESGPEEEAALLVISEVPEWVSFTLEQDTPYDDLAEVIADILETAHWPDTGALPLKIEGAIKRVDWHVIDGSRLPEGQASHEDHENAAVKGTLVDGSPILIGFYSTQHAGVITHGGVRLHIHVVDAERQISGHVEDALIGAGSVVRLPAPIP